MNTKEDFANALGTLLSLDRVMISNLMILKIETLAKMYTNYIQNAKDVNNKMEMALGAMKSAKQPSKNRERIKIGHKYIYGGIVA